MKASDEIGKVLILVLLIAAYLVVGGIFLVLVEQGVIDRAPPTPQPQDFPDARPTVAYSSIPTSESLSAALAYFEEHLRQPDGHINTFHSLTENPVERYDDTNSEAISYYLQISSQNDDQESFDQTLNYIETYMLHPQGDYLMWRLDGNRQGVGEGRNIAPDAELRALRALYIATDRWGGDQRYTQMIDTLATSLEEIVITDDYRMAAYGGMSGDTPWRGEVSYLAYSDFEVYDRLADTRRGVWISVAERMREITLGAQLENGLYNSEYWPESGYGTGIDGGAYSINSLWVMVRFAESNDPVLMASAQKSLNFYVDKFLEDARLYAAYTSSGEPAVDYESVWTYALVARAASALGEESFANIMENRMRSFQDLDRDSPHYGAFIEGSDEDARVGQFTMQEAILTLQEIEGFAPRFS